MPTVTPDTIIAPGYPEQVLADSPIGYWRLGEPSGTTAADASGNGHDGTYTSVSYGQTGALATSSDTAIKTDYLAGTVEIADNDVFDLTGDFTLECWAKQGTSVDAIHKMAVASSTILFRWRFGNSVVDLAQYSGTLKTVAATAPLNSDQWNHIVVTKSGTTVTHYKNGVANGSGTISGTIAASLDPVRIGYNSAADTYGGSYVDEFAVYNTALSAERIAAHYATGMGDPSVFAPVLVSGTVNVVPGFVGSAETMYAPGVQPGGVAIEPGFIDGAEQLYGPILSWSQILELGSITSSETMYALLAGTTLPGEVSSNIRFTAHSSNVHREAHSGTYQFIRPSSVVERVLPESDYQRRD